MVGVGNSTGRGGARREDESDEEEEEPWRRGEGR